MPGAHEMAPRVARLPEHLDGALDHDAGHRAARRIGVVTSAQRRDRAFLVSAVAEFVDAHDRERALVVPDTGASGNSG